MSCSIPFKKFYHNKKQKNSNILNNKQIDDEVKSIYE